MLVRPRFLFSVSSSDSRIDRCLEERRFDLAALLQLYDDELTPQLIRSTPDILATLSLPEQCSQIRIDEMPERITPDDLKLRRETESLSRQLREAQLTAAAGRPGQAMQAIAQLEPRVIELVHFSLRAEFLATRAGVYTNQRNGGAAARDYLQAMHFDLAQGNEIHAALDLIHAFRSWTYLAEDRNRAAELIPLMDAMVLRVRDQISVVASHLSALSIYHSRSRRHDLAARLGWAALELMRQFLPPGHSNLSELQLQLAANESLAGHAERAEHQFRQARNALVDSFGELHPRSILATSNLAVFLNIRGRQEEAQVEHLRALQLAEAFWGSQSTGIQYALRSRASHLRGVVKRCLVL